MLCPASTGSVTHSSPYHSSRRQPGESTTLFSLEDFLPRSHLVPPPSLHSCQITLHCQQAHSHLRRAPPHRLPPTAVARSAGRLLLWFLKSLVIARILRQPPIQVESSRAAHTETGRLPQLRAQPRQINSRARFLLRRCSQRSVLWQPNGFCTLGDRLVTREPVGFFPEGRQKQTGIQLDSI